MYSEQQKKRAANRSKDASELIGFLRHHGAAREIIAKRLYEDGKIPFCDGTRWPKNACGEGWVYWENDEPRKGVISGQAEFKLVISLGHHNATNKRREFRHRLFVRCQNCGTWIPTGRYHQHAGAPTCQANQKYMR